MPFPWAAVIPAAVSAAGSIFGGERSNRTNVREAARNRDFQERMRNTQWQSAVEDMRAAGINPALAYQQGPNAAPGGSQARVADAVTPGIQSALAVKSAQEQFKLMKAQRQHQERLRDRTKYESRIASFQADKATADYRFYFNSDGTIKPALKALLERNNAAQMATGARSISEGQLAGLRVPEQKALAELFQKVGGEGKAMQQFLPLILSILRSG